MKTQINKITRCLFAGCVLAMFGSANALALTDALKIRVEGNNYSDETVIRFINGATPGFDGNYDAYKLFSPNSQVPSLYTCVDSMTPLSINAYPGLDRQYVFDLFCVVNVPGSYSFRAIELGAFASGVCIVMLDLQSGSYYNMRDTNSYTFNLSANSTSSPARFRVYFATPVTPVYTVSACGSSADGIAIITKAGNPGWSYVLRDSVGNVIQTRNNINETDTLDNLSAGSYSIVEVNPYGCGNIRDFSIASTQVIALFQAPDSVFLPNATVNFSNNSQDALQYIWDFGDNTGQSNFISPSHNYNAAGTYTVTLTAINGNCMNAHSRQVTVLPDVTTAVETKKDQEQLHVYLQEGQIIVVPGQACGNGASVTLYNSIGQTAARYENYGSSQIVFTPEQSGMYIVCFRSCGTTITKRILYVN